MTDRYPEDHREVLDDTPVAIPSRVTRIDSEMERFQRFLRSEEMKKMAHEQGFESEEEANDFEVSDDDDFEMVSIHEEFVEFADEMDSQVLDEASEQDASPSPEAEPTPAEQIELEQLISAGTAEEKD